jgi:hypothetical protein
MELMLIAWFSGNRRGEGQQIEVLSELTK